MYMYTYIIYIYISMFPETLRVEGSRLGFLFIPRIGAKRLLPAARYGKTCFETRAASFLFPSGAEVDFVLVFTIHFVHRVFTHLTQCSFRPIICKGVAASAFSPLRPLLLRRTILSGKTQYFMNGAFSIFILRDERLYV